MPKGFTDKMNWFNGLASPRIARLSLPGVFLLMNFASATALAAGKCTDDPVVITISSTYQDPTTLVTYDASIRPDGLGSYNGVINVCSGSNDVTFFDTTKGSKRFVTYDYRNVVHSNPSTPSWVNSPVIGGGFNVANVLYNYSPSTTYSFTTAFSANSGGNANIYLRIQNPLRDTQRGTDQPNANTPCVTALVHVQHIPATPSSKETWIVWSDSATGSSCTDRATTPLQVGSLLDSRTSPWSSVGQFSLPFYVIIRRP
jgi:hypothetical protein